MTLTRSILLACAAVSGVAHGAPVIRGGNDLFDHLATTFPIEDWIKHARNQSISLDHAQPLLHPRFTIIVSNSPPGLSEFDMGAAVRCGTARPDLSRTVTLMIVPDPCVEPPFSVGTPRDLPDRVGLRRVWSVDFAEEFEADR